MAGFKSAEQVLDYAIAREREAYDLYTQMSGWAKRPEARQALEEMAYDELQHCLRLEAFKSGEIAIEPEEIGSLKIDEGIPDVKPDKDMSYTDVLAVAMKKEKAAFQFYTGLAAMLDEGPLKETLQALAQEEASHKLRLEIEYDLQTF